MLVRLEVDW